MKVHFNLKHDVEARDGKRYLCVEVVALGASDPKTGLFGDTHVAVWVPFKDSSTVAQLREAALAAAQKSSAAFSKIPRSKVTFIAP